MDSIQNMSVPLSQEIQMLFHCWNGVSHFVEYTSIIHNIPGMNTLYALSLSTCRIIFSKYAFFCFVYFHCKLLHLQIRGGRRDFGMSHILKMHERKDTFQVNVACSIDRIKTLSNGSYTCNYCPNLERISAVNVPAMER